MATSSAAFVPSYLRPNSVGTAVTTAGNLDPQKTLANRLADKLGLKPGELDGPANNYTPDKVADRILGFVDGSIKSKAASGADNAELQKMFAQAREGVEKGFEEAKKILDGLGVLGGKVAADIEETYRKISAGLDKLGESLGIPASSSGETESTTSITGDYSDRHYQANSQSFDMELTTLEGDTVRIRAANASSSSAASSAEGSASQQLQMSGYSVEVEGELSEAELSSLKDLFGKVEEISDKFYSGDLQGAFDQALKLNIDNSQLASLSLNMTQVSVRATETYGSVADAGKAGSSNSALNDYAKSLLDGLQTAGDLTSAPGRTMSELLKGAFSIDERFNQKSLDKAESLNNRLLEGLEQLNAKEPTEENDSEPQAIR